MQSIASNTTTTTAVQGGVSTPSYATVALLGGKQRQQRHQAKPENNPDRHGVSATGWLTFNINTRTRKCSWFGQAGQKTMEREVPGTVGEPKDWDSVYPTLQSTIRRTTRTVETRVQPAKDLIIPVSFTITNGAINGAKEEEVEKKKDKKKNGSVKKEVEIKEARDVMEERLEMEKNKEKNEDLVEIVKRNEHNSNGMDKDYGVSKKKDMEHMRAAKDMIVVDKVKNGMMDMRKMVHNSKECNEMDGIVKEDNMNGMARDYGVSKEKNMEHIRVVKNMIVMDKEKSEMVDMKNMDHNSKECYPKICNEMDAIVKEDKMNVKSTDGEVKEYGGKKGSKIGKMQRRDKKAEQARRRKMNESRRRVCGGGEEEKNPEEDGQVVKDVKEKDPKSRGNLRFSKTVNVRLLRKEDGNEDTLRTVLTDVVAEGAVRLTKAVAMSPIAASTKKDYRSIDPSSPSTTAAEQMVIDANASFDDLPLPDDNDTIPSITMDSNLFPSNNSSFYDERLDTYSDDALAKMIKRDMFDPHSFYRITIQFMLEEQIQVMDNVEWMMHRNGQIRSDSDFYLGSEAIYAGLLKMLSEAPTDKYAIALPVSLESNYDVDEIRIGVVRRADPEWILQPLHFGHHWILACCNPTTRDVIIYDSLAHNYSSPKKMKVKSMVQKFFDLMLNIKTKVRYARKDYIMQQTDSVNCGIFVLIHARRFVQGRRKLIGKAEDRGVDLDEERKELLILMKCLYQHILLNHDVSAPMQQYAPIECTFERETRRSPRNLVSTINRIKECVAQITPKTRRPKNVPAPLPSTPTSPAGSPPVQSSSPPPTTIPQPPSVVVSSSTKVKQRDIVKRRNTDVDSSDTVKRRRLAIPGEVIDVSKRVPRRVSDGVENVQRKRGNKRRSQEELEGNGEDVKRMRSANVTERRRGRRSAKTVRPIDEMDTEVDLSSPRRCHKRRRFQVLDEEDDDDPEKKRRVSEDGRTGDNESIGSRQ